MAKSLRTAAIVVGAAALIATGVGAAVGAGVATAAGSAGIGTLSIATVASTASAVSAGLSLAAGVATPKGTVGGNATKFKIDKDAGLPLVFGRTYVGGNVGHRQYYNDPGSRMKNQRESWVTILSLGPVHSVGPLLVDKAPVSFTSGGSAIGTYAGNMWLDTQLGACPEARALQGPNGDFPGWNATSKLSGLAADLWTLDFDSKGKKFPNGVPQRGRVVEGVFVWDPRLDDTWPGGVGPCRRDNPDTWVYTECPWLLGLQFALGYFQNGFLMAGGGMAVTGIDVQTIVSAANVSDANGWKAGGQVYVTTDNSWDILQMLAQAGGGEFLNVGGMLTCTYSAPRPSIGTITSADIAGTIDTPSASSRRKRRNIFIPSVRLESHGWEVVPLDALKIDEYIEADGAPRPKADVFPLVQDANQGAELALYWLFDQREIDGIVIPCKIYACGYRPGDCLTLQLPEANLVDRQVVLRTAELDMGSMGVTFGCRTETPGKHPYALGATGTPPPTPDLSITGPDLSAPDVDDWIADGATLTSGGASIPAIVIAGEVTNGAADAVAFEYRVAGASDWLPAGIDPTDTVRKEITGLIPETSYDIAIRYRVRGLLGDRLLLGPVTAGELAVQRGAHRIASRTVAYPWSSDDDSISIEAFDGVLDDGRAISFAAQTIELLAAGMSYGLFWSISGEAWSAAVAPATTDWGSSDLVFLQWVATSEAGTFPGSPTPPPGSGGDGGGGYQQAEIAA